MTTWKQIKQSPRYEKFIEQWEGEVISEWNEHGHCSPVYEIDHVPDEFIKEFFEDVIKSCSHDNIKTIYDDPRHGGGDTYICKDCGQCI